MNKLLLSCLLLSALAVGNAAAQPKPKAVPAPPPQSAKIQQPTHFDFDEDEVEGSTYNPLGEQVSVATKPRQSSLVTPRTTFTSELVKSAEGL